MTTAVRGELVEPRTAVLCPDFDLALTLRSGQLFRWRQGLSPKGTVPFFSGWIGGSLARVSKEGDRLILDGVSPEPARHFFALDLDLPAITRQIGVDPIIHDALGRYPGLRVVRQDPWECAASFMLSAYNNIPRLTGMLETLAGHFGRSLAPPGRGFVRTRSERLEGAPGRSTPLGPQRSLTPLPGGAKDGGFYRFPSPAALVNVSERMLRNCGLGYRAPYLKGMAQAVVTGRADLERWRELEDEELRRALLTLPGIGEKVVECVMLFAYGRVSAFPVDVWIGRAMRAWYFRRRKVSDKKIREFARKHFGPYCGWAQQYLYCLARWHPENSRL